MRIVITGGAGFVGSSLAVFFKEVCQAEVYCLDNLKRRGSELSLCRLKKHGVRFIHGDVRNRSDLSALPGAEVLIECSAEPSVLAGFQSSPDYLLETNIGGAVNCFEWARSCKAMVIFLSTSRVYPYSRLKDLPLVAEKKRFVWNGPVSQGTGPLGISENFPLGGCRSLYGASKLSAELLLAEYGDAYEVPFVINRCGVLTGPWQFGKTDQGVFMYWMLNHCLGRPLTYIGFEGEGKQVRDLLHSDDLAELIKRQLDRPSICNGKTYNVGGGLEGSLSLREATEICQELTGRSVTVASEMGPRPGDIPWYVTDTSRVRKELGWQAKRRPPEVLADIYAWIRKYENDLREALD